MLKQSMHKEAQRGQRKQAYRAEKTAAALEAVTQYGEAPCSQNGCCVATGAAQPNGTASK